MRDSAAQFRRAAYEESRAADQCGYEAGFLDEAATALGMLLHARQNLPALEAAAEGAVTSERVADDKLRNAVKNLTRRQADERRLDGRANVSPDVRDEAAVRTRRASRTVDEDRAALATGHARRQQAELALNELQLRLAGLETAWAAAAWRAQHPGEAPRTSPMMLGGVTAADMTDEEREFMGGMLTLMAASTFRGEPRPRQAGSRRSDEGPDQVPLGRPARRPGHDPAAEAAMNAAPVNYGAPAHVPAPVFMPGPR